MASKALSIFNIYRESRTPPPVDTGSPVPFFVGLFCLIAAVVASVLALALVEGF